MACCDGFVVDLKTDLAIAVSRRRTVDIPGEREPVHSFLGCHKYACGVIHPAHCGVPSDIIIGDGAVTVPVVGPVDAEDLWQSSPDKRTAPFLNLGGDNSHERNNDLG